MKKIALLGSTGSIGTLTLDVVRRFPEEFQVIALAAGGNIDVMARQIEEFRPAIVSVTLAEHRDLLYKLSADKCVDYLHGDEGLQQVAAAEEADMVISALSGSAGLLPTKTAIEAGKDVGLANKESMVMGGRFLSELARDKGVRIIPIDSEHSAIFQCLQGNRLEDVKNLILTASGGPFINFSKEQMEVVTPEQALDHPVWDMGAKITIDSATLMNKGLEVIEARWLFGISPDRIEVVVHRQSIIHSMVRYRDGSIMSQLGRPDMRIPILYALTCPERWPLDLPRLDFSDVRQLTFEQPDYERFPCLGYAFDALKMGGGAPIVLNSADEVAVDAFLKQRIHFCDIPYIIGKTLDKEASAFVCCFDDIMDIDARARRTAHNIITQIGQ